MRHYCTYFDLNYAVQGLALWRSLARHDPEAVLWVLALDENTKPLLEGLNDARLRVVALRELLEEDAALAGIQGSRPRSEFIFTLTPCLVRHLWKTRPELESIAYLDADLFFFNDPNPVWDEFASHSVLVIEHRFPAWHDDSHLYGRYNVGMLVFRRDENGKACIDWWRERCLESCALAADGTRYGDQKYLDEWPRLFAGVVSLTHPGVNLAPWNWARFHYELRPDGVRIEARPLVLYHFAQFKRISGHWFDSGQLEYGIMPIRLRSRIYGAYWNALESAERELGAVAPGIGMVRKGWKESLGTFRIAILRLFWGQFWFRSGSWWIAGRLGIGRFSGRFMGSYRRNRRGGS